MRLAFAAVLLASCSAVAGTGQGANAPGSPDTPEGWVELMKPDVWKKYDPAWIVADEVKPDAEKNTRLKAEKKDGGKAWVNGEKGRLPDLITKAEYGDCEVHVEFLIAKN